MYFYRKKIAIGQSRRETNTVLKPVRHCANMMIISKRLQAIWICRSPRLLRQVFLRAVAEVAKECKYQEATVKTIISALRDVFSYAATCGHAYNILPQKLRGRQADESYDLDGAEDISPGSGKRGAERIER